MFGRKKRARERFEAEQLAASIAGVRAFADSIAYTVGAVSRRVDNVQDRLAALEVVIRAQHDALRTVIENQGRRIMHAKPNDQELLNRFTYHAPHGDQPERYGKIRQAGLEFAKVIRDNTPCSPAQTLAINAIDVAVMQANASIARNEPKPTQ